MERKAKIVMIAMFKNEAAVMRRMLESVGPHIDYYVIQNNGSTDGTDDIVRDYFNETGIEGVLYDVEEGWVGFGWNRDHLIQYCQSVDHGCDWILKMDCDEFLHVDDDFDWSILENTSVHSWDVPAFGGTAVYFRTWMWNAKLPWRFNHDPCHETIYCADPNIGEQFQRVRLPIGFRQVDDGIKGQSWGVPTKFISDSLVLEEKMIREGNMLDNLYHFFYIGKSYFDAHTSSGFPLKLPHQREYARRAIWYLHQWVTKVHPKGPRNIDEMAYNALMMAGEAYEFLEEYENAEVTFRNAHGFAPERNDHLINMIRMYEKMGDYRKMLATTTLIVNPNRKNPFPRYSSWIDFTQYIDTGKERVEALHKKAQKLAAIDKKQKAELATPLIINKGARKRLFVVDNFYENPDAVREYALQQEYQEDLRFYKGLRTKKHYHPEGIVERFEYILGERIRNFPEGVNGCFQITRSSDPQVYHNDEQRWAAMIYLSPNAPLESGTRLHRSKINGARNFDEDGRELIDEAFKGDFYDSTKFEITDSAGNIYNRCLLMDAKCIHSAGPYFGNTPETGRLTHLFFFD